MKSNNTLFLLEHSSQSFLIFSQDSPSINKPILRWYQKVMIYVTVAKNLILNPNMLISHCQLVRVECWWFISDDAISVVLNQKAVDSIVSFCRCSCCVLLRVFRSRARCCIKHSLILKPNMLISHRQLVRVECWLFISDDAISVVLQHKAVVSIVSFCCCSRCTFTYF